MFIIYDKIAHKVDLWRYCILYDTGGIYLDADCLLLNNIENIVTKYNMLFVTNNREKEDISAKNATTFNLVLEMKFFYSCYTRSRWPHCASRRTPRTWLRWVAEMTIRWLSGT